VSRQLRLEFPGAIWHITSRGNERRHIYRDDVDRRLFLRFLARVVIERRWRLHAWVLMANHYHLLIETPEVGLSRGMKWLNQTYAEAFNARHERVGHLFQGRFKAILVEREGHLLELLRYVVLNPVRCGAVGCAGEYQWSSYLATAGLRTPPRWLDVDWTLAQFCPSDRRAAQEAYRRFVAAGATAPYDPREAIIGQIYLGSIDFRERMQELVETEPRSREIPATQRRLARPALETLAALVADGFGIASEALKTKSRGVARKALAQLAVDDAGLTLKSVAQWMGVSPWAASKMRSAGRRLYTEDGGYRERVDGIKAALS
jgi:REP element-mobilizing transposase RayT